MYCLMNKDTLVATFEITKTYGTATVFNLQVYDILPLGCTEKRFTSWVKGRFSAKHRSHLAAYLNQMGAGDMEGFINLTHSISINDTYWIKKDTEYITWSDVSPYDNEFDEVIQHLAFDGAGLFGEKMSSTSPEFGTNGAYEKCWEREADGIYLYKRGTEGFSNAGLEPYCEGLASQIFEALNAGIHYDIVNYRKRKASKCKLFTNDKVGFAPYSVIDPESNGIVDAITYFSSIGCDEQIRRMLICDALTFNTDRHYGNFGCLIDTATQSVLTMAPCFDFNLALFPMEVNDAFTNTTGFINNYTPKLGDNFVDVAKSMLNSKLRSELINLKGFEYRYEGDEYFTQDRVKWLSIITNNQIDNILGTTSVYMYSSPNKECVSNIYKYREKMRMTEEDFQKDVPRLMKLFGIQHMSELEERIIELL